jgi:hypothetical protein
MILWREVVLTSRNTKNENLRRDARRVEKSS